MYVLLIFKILTIHFFAVASPGPDFLMVTKNALNYNRKTGVWTAIGVGTGIAIHVFYGIGGISILIAKNVAIYNFLKYAGAIYLIYIGVKSLGKVKKRAIIQKENVTKHPISTMSAFKMGFWTNVLNPKATLFFLSIFSTMIPVGTPSYILIIIGILLILNTGLWFILVSFLFTQSKVQLLYYKYEHLMNVFFALALFGLAIKILFF